MLLHSEVLDREEGAWLVGQTRWRLILYVWWTRCMCRLSANYDHNGIY